MPKLKPKDESCMKVTVADAAKMIGCDKDYLRQRMKRKEWDLGEVVPPKRAGGIYRYIIFKPKLERFLGIGKEAV